MAPKCQHSIHSPLVCCIHYNMSSLFVILVASGFWTIFCGVIQQTIQQLNEQSLRQLLRVILESHPGILFDAWETLQSQPPPPPSQPPPPPPSPPPQGTPGWCVCGRCREMPTDVERLCCSLHQCVSQRPEYQ